MHSQNNKISREAKTISPFLIPLGIVFLFQMLSYPLISILPSYVIELVTSKIPNPSHYLFIAYIATASTYTAICLATLLGPCKALTRKFQRKTPKQHKKSYYNRLFIGLSFTILAICLLAFHQAGMKIPLLEVVFGNNTGYGLYRKETEAALSESMMNISLYFLLPATLFIAFFSPAKNNKKRIISIFIFCATLAFFLARSKVAIPILILTSARIAYAPITKKALTSSILAISLLGLAMISLSTGTTGNAAKIMSERTIHGQWLGLPLYFWHYENEKANPVSYINPTILGIAGVDRPKTPGRELMEYLNPAGVEAGTAGVIPSYFAGEAFALFGWIGVFFATIHIILYILLISWAMSRLPKNIFTCILYGALLYKLSSGLTNGYSSFLISSTTIAVLLVSMLAMAATHKRWTMQYKKSNHAPA